MASRAKNLTRQPSSSSSDMDHALQIMRSEQNNKELFTGWEHDQRTQRDEHPKRYNQFKCLAPHPILHCPVGLLWKINYKQ